MLDQLISAYRYWEVRRRAFASREALRKHQEARVWRLLKDVLPRSAHTRARLEGLSLERWREMPVMEKAGMMEHFDALNTVGATREEAFAVARRAEQSRDFRPLLRGCTVGLSSGTTGRQGVFLVSAAERRRWAGSILAKMLPRGLFAGERIAFFLRASSNLYETVGSRRLRFEFFDLLDDFERHLARLRVLRPTILAAPPSLLRELAHQALVGRLDLPLVRVISVAEVLDPLDQALIEEAFGGPVHQVYQATEGFLAATCSRGVLHLNEDLVIVEREPLESGSGRFVPVVTDLCRRTQPIIRYRLNDLLTLRAEPCPCGSVMLALERIEGRCDDAFWLPKREGEEMRMVFPDFIRKAILEADDSVTDYQARQLSPWRVELYLRTDRAEARPRVVAALSALWEKLGVGAPAVTFSETPSVRTAAQKLRRVERCFSLENERGPVR